MKYTRLGRSGLEVSRLCLGGMSFGQPDAGTHAWTLPEEDSRPIIRKAVELGINFFDTANVYSAGTGEEILGRALADFANRDEIVIATKVFGRMRPGPNGAGLSRKAIFTAIDASLRRLGTDHVDLYQIHRFDPDTPIEETMEALHDVVKAGKARYLGASSMYAWQFARMQETARANGFTPFISMQNHLNLIYREEEREMIPLCIAEGVSLMPWSPLARGKLARKPDETSARTETDLYGRGLYSQSEAADRAVISRVAELSARTGQPMARLALAWVLSTRPVASPIIGATKAQHLDDAVAALDCQLTDEERRFLEEPYVPHAPAGLD